MEVLVLCFLFGVSLAQSGTSFPKVADLKQGYEPLNTYTYKYDACVSSFFKTEKQFAGLRITGDVEFYIASYTEAYLKIINPKLYEVNGTWYCTSDSLKVSSYSDELAPLLEQPVKFEYRRGKVGRIFCDKDEPDYILNIKRGILSMLHHNFTTPEPSYYDKKPRMYNNWEYGSHGMCGSIFNVRYKTNPDTSKIDEMEVDKTLDVMNCTVKPRVVSNVPGMRCNSKDCDVIDEPFKIDVLTQCKMTGTESKFAVKSCKLTGIYSFAPSQLKGSGTTRVKQMMDFKEVKSYAQEIYLENSVERTLEMTTEEEQKPLTDEERNKMVAKVTKLIGYLMNDYEQKTWMAWRFPSLIDVLRKADKETLYKIWNTCYTHEKHRYWLLEALPYVQKEDVFALITEKIWQKELIPTEAVPVLRGLALTVNPTEQMCLHISDLCYREQVQQDESLKKTCYLSSGALMYEYCKDKGKNCLLTQANKMKAKLLNADFEEKIIILKSIGNFGHKTLYAPLVDIILDTQTPLELRVTATYALRRIGPQVPNKVIPVMLQIFQGMNNDEELRMACFVVFIDCNPSPAVFRLVVKHIKKSNSNQLLAFVVSYVKGIAYSKYPCDEKIAKTARTALRMLRKFQPGILSSKWLHYGDFSDLHQIGGSVDWQMMSTPSSMIPRALTTKFKLHILGRSVNMFETGIRGEGIQELLKRVVGPRGHYTKNKSWFGFLRPKRSVDSSSYDKEVGEIQDMLPIVDYEEEKPKGSMYFKVLGKELFYNYFTYDDVRELVEDGVIRVNQDLKDVLKKGKKWNMTKVFMPVEITISHPSCVGLPLKFTLQSVLLVHLNTTIKAEVEPKFFIPIPDKVTVYGKANISMYHYTWGKMFVYLPQLAAGNKMTVKTNVTTGLAGKFHYNHKDYSTSMEFDLPEKRKQIFSAEKNAYTFTKYYKPYSYKSTKMDGFEIGDVTEVFGEQGYHRYANWTLKTSEGKYLSVNDQNELILADTPTVFKVFFVNKNHYFVKLYVEGKGFVKVKPDSKGCLETAHDYRYPKLFKIIMTREYTSRHIRLATVVFIHSDETKNPTEWTTSTAPLNTDQVMLFKHMIEKVPSEVKYAEKWRFVSDYPIDNDVETFHPRHMKIVYVTPTDEGKVCLRPDESMESVFSVKRHYENESEICYNQTILGCDVCMSGRYMKSSSSDPIPFPFCGPMKFNVSVQPSTNHAKTLKIKFGKSEPYSDTYKTWRAGMYLTGTTPEKKVETVIAYNATNNQFNVTADFYHMHPWLKKVCITNKVVYGNEVKFFLNFGEDCEDYKIQSRITVKEPSRTELHIMTSYNKLPDSMLLTMCYKLLKKFVKRYYDKFSDISRGLNTPNTAEFVVKFKTDQIVDLELIGPSKTLKMENIKQKTPGFVPRASEHFSTFMQMMAWSSPVCIADHTTFKTYDDVEFQYSLPDHCMHVLTKDCTKNQTFMVLMSTEPQATHKKILEIFVEKNKIRVEHMDKGQYQIQVNGKIVPLKDKELRINSVATIMEESQKEELHVWCDIGLRIALVRGTKVEVRVSPWFVNRTCGICGDCNGEQYFDLKTPMGEEFTSVDTQKYGHMWMVPENTCTKGGCHLKKEYKLIRKRVDEQDYDCFPTVPVLRCYDECLVTKSTTTTFPMTCVRTGSKEASKIFKDMEKRVLDLTGSEIHYYDDLREDIECDCSRCGQ